MKREQAKAWIKIFEEIYHREDAYELMAQVLGHNGFEKHFDIIQHFAYGGNVEWLDGRGDWQKVSDQHEFFDNMQHRIAKPKTHTVNGFEVPAPEREPLKTRQPYYTPNAAYSDWYGCTTWDGCKKDSRRLERNVVFLTPEAAIANAKAMCGIDPNGGDDEY